MSAEDHSATYLAALADAARAIDPAQLDAMAHGLADVRERGGRLFILGLGGGAGHASHAVNDFRKLCLLESYAPTDNVSELTARTNDDGWATSLSAWLEVSRLSRLDALLVFSVSGGSRERKLSTNLVTAMDMARAVGAPIYGVGGAPGGVLAELADLAILIAPPPALHTPLVESSQAAVWHGLVSHPRLALRQAQWESLGRAQGVAAEGVATGGVAAGGAAAEGVAAEGVGAGQ
jgi:D-sedoheptulose 7-phosphate isomerase